MKPLVLTLRARPDQRLDLSQVVPHFLAGKSAAEIAALAVNTTRQPFSVGDAFRIRMGDPRQIRFEGGCDRLDMIGQAMRDGEILIEGDVGCQAGRLMQGGRLVISGSAGPWAASGMKGGTLEIGGGAGDRLGGPLAGEMAGMRGGIVVVRGDTGDRAGDRMRRGTIVVEGRAGAYAGSRMIAGSLIIRGAAGALPGYLMRRGTLVLGGGSAEPPPTFVDCGAHDLLAMRLIGQFLQSLSKPAAALFRAPLRRFAGDMAVLGKGEILAAEIRSS